MNNIIKPNNYTPIINSDAVIQSNSSDVQKYKEKYLKIEKYLSEFKTELEKKAARTNLGVYSKTEVTSKIKDLRDDLGYQDDSPNQDGNAFERINYLIEEILKLTGDGETSVSELIKKAIDELKGNVSTEYDTLKKIEDIIKNHILNFNNPHKVTKAQIQLGNVTNDALVKRSEMGKPLGVATLDEYGKIPSNHLPSYVDDVVDCYATFEKTDEGLLTNILLYTTEEHTTPIVGETGKIYTDVETSYQFRWSGTLWSVVGAPTVIGTATGTAFDGKRGKDLETKATLHIANTNNPHNVTPQQIGAIRTGGLKTINNKLLEGEGNINVEDVFISDTPPEGDNYKLFVEINEEAEAVEVYTKLETDSKFAEKSELNNVSFFTNLEEEYPQPDTTTSDTATKALQDWDGNDIREHYVTLTNLDNELLTYVKLGEKNPIAPVPIPEQTSADFATQAILDDEGNIIKDTYIKKGYITSDEDDIQSTNDGEGRQVFKLADRSYNPENFSGKGYKILRKNVIDGKNVLTQEMINEANTVYEIRYDFDLGGEEITIPEGCIVYFNGGSLSNGLFKSKLPVNCYRKSSNDYYDFSETLKCDLYNLNGDNGLPINPYSKRLQKIKTKVLLPVGYWKKSTSINLSDDYILYIKSCGALGIVLCIAIHWDSESLEPYTDFPEQVYTYFKTNKINIESIKFHIDGGTWINRSSVIGLQKYSNLLLSILKNFQNNGNHFNSVFILNEWTEATKNEDMIPTSLELSNKVKEMGYKTGIAFNNSDISPLIVNSDIDYLYFNIYPIISLYDEETTIYNTDIYTPFSRTIKKFENDLKYKIKGITESGCNDTYTTLRGPAFNYDNTKYEEYSPLINLYHTGLFKYVTENNIDFLCLWYGELLYKGKVEEIIKSNIF